ncbi:thiazole synthase [Marinomonas sp. 15G1-11]|uniref:Thiazole synthase n=1 Tax=Marinomonas phaeophyticola TaxID=3004091 RepID=A0ABT4JYU2_9GAMM|nr:thiazole synthase [Marinomonas sp. 15G1-11]MCZ2722928.1 thiazole synthase [Marinomonas sp. 15G1-11]
MNFLENDPLIIGDHTFSSRLFTGTGKYATSDSMMDSIKASGSELVTLSLRRVDLENHSDNILSPLQQHGMKLLPNTSGARSAKEAVFAANLAREALATNWVKLEIHPDPRYLMPDPIETLEAAEILVKQGFIVMPYVHADPVLCKRLEEVGCQCVMPLGAPIGSNKGLASRTFLDIIIEQSRVPVIVDAGIGSPADAALAMQLGADGVLVNTAMAVARKPAAMGYAFRLAVEAGRVAYHSGLGEVEGQAMASSPMTDFLVGLS